MSNQLVTALKPLLIAAAIIALIVEVPPLVIPKWKEAWLDAVSLLIGLLFLTGYAVRLGWKSAKGLGWLQRLGTALGLAVLSWFTMSVLMFLIPGQN